MEDRTIIFMGIALAGFLIASLSGRLSLSIIITTCLGCILLYFPLFSPKELSGGHFIEILWIVICMGLLPVIVTAGFGSYLGNGVRKLTSKTKKPTLFLWGTISLAIVVVGITSMLLIIRERALIDFSATVKSQGKAFISQQPESFKEAGPITVIFDCNPSFKVGLFGNSINGLRCSVGGPQGESWVMLSVSGTTTLPKFSVTSVEPTPHSRTYPLR